MQKPLAARWGALSLCCNARAGHVARQEPRGKLQ
jgi:hypothetical protein